jgi:neutral trehalase
VLERIDLTDGKAPQYERIDRTLVDPAERPTDWEYDRYAYLVKLYRDLSYNGAAIRDACPFVVHDVLFNSLLVQSNRDVAELARDAGADSERHEQRAELTAAALDQLWSEEEEAYFDRDVRSGERIPVLAGSAFAPLYARAPSTERARTLVGRLDKFRVEIPPAGWAIPSLSTSDPAFEPIRYWRGPVWPIVNWVTYRGLRRYGYEERAAQLRASLLELARREGFREHYNPITARGQGGEQFAWTAGLILDLLAAQDVPA